MLIEFWLNNKVSWLTTRGYLDNNSLISHIVAILVSIIENFAAPGDKRQRQRHTGIATRAET